MLYLHRGEWLAIGIVCSVLLWTAIAQAIAGIDIHWMSFVPSIGFFAIFTAFGLLIRFRGLTDDYAVLFIVFGLVPIFASVLSIANMSAFPLRRPLIDETLFAIDRLFGYEWDKAVLWVAGYPGLSELLAKVYRSSFSQILALIVFLGVTRRAVTLHHFMLTMILSSIMTLAFWLVWPSFGPSAYLTPEPEVATAAGLVVTPEYGAVLMHFAEQGLGTIERHLVLGTVAFPSYHIVMSLLVVWFARGTLVFWPALIFNLPMIPGTLIHGGHHLIDLPGGLVCFALAVLLAGRLLRAGKPMAASAAA